VWTQSRLIFLKDAISAAIAVGLTAVAGCSSSPPPPQQDPPIVQNYGGYAPVIDRPMPDPAPTPLPPGFDDPAIMTQEMPEEPAFVALYKTVGSPRIMVFVNRAISGEELPVAPGGTTHYPDGTTVYSPTGTTDVAGAKSIDYELIENLISGDMSAGGRVTMVSPIAARGRLSDAEVADLRSGRPQMLGEIAQKLQCDVLIRISARPSVQTADGLGIRLVAEAMNVQGGQQLSQSAVDVPPPLIKTTLNRYCRFVSRELMTGMTAQWSRMPSMAAPSPTPAPAPVAPMPTAPQFAPPPAATSTPTPAAAPVVSPQFAPPPAATTPKSPTTEPMDPP
jgi:hypothetical protein